MPWNATDGLLVLAVVASTYYAYQTIPDTLNHIRNLAACPEQAGPGPRKQLQKDAENAISIDTLRTLSNGHSYDLRASTIKIVASRALKSRTKRLLLKDLASKDEVKRYNAICAIWMLLFNPALHGKRLVDEFLDYKTFYALITALQNVLVEHKPDQHMQLLTPGDPLYPEPRIPPSPLRPSVRPYQETSLMMILRAFLDTARPYDKLSEFPDNITCALSAGLVTRWLKDYPFPCALPQNSKYNYKKSDVVSLFERRAWAMDDQLMAGLINDIGMTAMGKKHLRDAGLRGSSYTEIEDVENAVSRWRHFPTRLDAIDTDRDVRMTNGESTAGAITPPPIRRHWSGLNDDVPHTRAQELSREEEALRRRRREAVVVAEPGMPLSQDNVLQRTDSGSAWRSDIETGVEDSSNLTLPPLTIDNSPESLRRRNHEERFNILMRDLLSQRAMLHSLRDQAIENLDIQSDDILDGLLDLNTSIGEYRDQITNMLIHWNLSEDQHAEFLRRLDLALNDTWDFRSIADRTGMLREENTRTNPAENGVDSASSEEDSEEGGPRS